MSGSNGCVSSSRDNAKCSTGKFALPAAGIMSMEEPAIQPNRKPAMSPGGSCPIERLPGSGFSRHPSLSYRSISCLSSVTSNTPDSLQACAAFFLRSGLQLRPSGSVHAADI
ncbi:hypothetical protein SD71_11865 [Cohnella kolymensis]|uniref:Uncharacterized protein n=1 Tax=Cohnella kolymensis TaxID=1590652 RepID=A0ABR5A6F0_9BACL|nr:hypothetical protein SD71_11865 [Cohnella kolymensis]